MTPKSAIEKLNDICQNTTMFQSKLNYEVFYKNFIANNFDNNEKMYAGKER